MRGHQHISVNGNLELPGSLFQAAQEKTVIGTIAKNCFTIVAGLNNVMRLIGYDEPGKSSHGLNES